MKKSIQFTASLRFRLAVASAIAFIALPGLLAKCKAQTLRGTVVDSAGFVVTDAEVTATSKRATSSIHTVKNGEFEFKDIAPPADVTVHAAGFAAATTTWNGEPSISITLKPGQVQQEIVVTANRVGTPLADVPSSVSRLSLSQIAGSPYLQLDDILRQVPGFSLFRRTSSLVANPTTQGVSLRGLGASGASRALVFFDDIPLNDPFGGWVYWDRVPLTDIAALEALRGGGSALYGSGALAGVVAVERRDFSNRALSLDLSEGQLGISDGSATLSQHFGPYGISASAQGLRSDGYVPVPSSLRGSVDTPASLRYGTGRLYVDRQFSNGTAFVSGNLFNESRNNGTVLQVNDTRLAEGEAGTNLGLAGGALSLRTFLTAQHFDQTFSSIAVDRNSESLVRAQAVPAQQFGFSAVWNRQLGQRNTFALGVDFRRVTGHSAETLFTRGAATGAVDSGGRQRYFGAFLEDSLLLTSRLRITAATRADSWKNYDARSRSRTFASGVSSLTPFADRDSAAFSPSLGAVYQLTHLVALTGSAYGAFRTPTLNELYRAFRLGNVLTQANDALHPERLRGADGGVTIGSAPIFLRATYFWNKIHDAVGNRTISTTPTLITRQRQNIGDILAKGVEVELEANLPKHIVTRTAYEYSDSTISRSLDAALLGLHTPQVPLHAASQSLIYNGRRWSGTVTGRYVTRQFDDDLNTFLLPSYFTADMMLRWRLGSRVESYLACENLFDRDYFTGRTPTPTLGTPRLVRGGVRLRLGSAR
jgi:outer membrane receptor protein involved in Fe transport